MGFDVARSTILGNAKASISGTSNEEIPRFPFNLCLFLWDFRSEQERTKYEYIRTSKEHLQDVINQQVDATVCPLDDAKIHAAIVDYILAALLEGDDGVANEKCGDELIKLFEGKLGEAALTSFVARVDSVYDTVRTICYLSDKGDGPFGWNVLNN